MAWTDLKAAVAEVVKTNGTQAITGALLQSTLNSIIDQVGANATFKGVATPATTPGTPDGPLFYIAYEKGIYANFNAINITEEDGLVIILYSSNWNKINIPLALKDELVQFRSDLNELEQEQIQGGVYDVSSHNDGAVFESLSTLLRSANLSTLIPTSVRHGGMSIRFVNSSDNKYVQYRLMSSIFNTTPSNWQGVDDEPTFESNNLVKSGSVYELKNGSTPIFEVLTDGTLQNIGRIVIANHTYVLRLHQWDVDTSDGDDIIFETSFTGSNPNRLIVSDMSSLPEYIMFKPTSGYGYFHIKGIAGQELKFECFDLDIEKDRESLICSMSNIYNNKILIDNIIEDALPKVGVVALRNDFYDTPKEIFDLSDVSVGDTLKYRIEITTQRYNGVTAFIQLYNSDNEIIGEYGKTMASIGMSRFYSGSFTIPNNFHHASIHGTAIAKVIVYHEIMLDIKNIPGIKVITDKYFGIVDVTSYIGGGITEQSSNKILPAGNYAVILPKLKNETSVFENYTEYIISISDTTIGNIYELKYPLKKYGFPYVKFTLQQQGYLTLRVREDEGIGVDFYIIKDPDENVLKSLQQTENNYLELSDFRLNSLKKLGVLAYHVPFIDMNNYIHSTEIFNINDVEVGQKIYYSITLPSEFGSGYNGYITLQDSEGTVLAEYGKTLGSQSAVNYSGEFTIPEGFSRAVIYGTCIGAYLDYVGTEAIPTKLLDRIVAAEQNIITLQNQTQAPNVTPVDTFSFSGEITTLFSNEDASAITNVDDGLLNTVCVVKINDSMYYMYYECVGLNDAVGDSNMRLCFAYSTDGFHYTKGFPAGITAPIEGTNQLLPIGSTHGHCVVKVPDYEYPYRLIACGVYNGVAYTPMIYKSKDGVNFMFIRAISGDGADSPISCVVRGNTLKIFIRSYATSGNGRSIGILYTDLDGNLYIPKYWNPSKCYISLEDRNRQLYEASASILDDKRELLMAGIYNPDTYEFVIGCIVLNGLHFEEKEINLSHIYTSDVKLMFAAPGLINIGLYTYMIYTVRDTDHEHSQIGVTKSAFRMVRLNIY